MAFAHPVEILKAALFGVVEGITEWLPISSTGHMILLDQFLTLDVRPAFWELFLIVIQLGAILAVVVLYFEKLNPFSSRKSPAERRGTWQLWFRVVAAVLPSALLFPLDDWLDEHLHSGVTVAVMLILYGVFFLLLERRPRTPTVTDVGALTYRTALAVGFFQALSVIPGTSRSGATILGGILLGLSRTAAAEFSFFMAIPTMLGASGLKIVKFALSGARPTGGEYCLLAVGCAVAFLVSLLAIRYLTDFVKRHTFSAFGVYRIALGAVVLAVLTFI